MRIGEEVDAIWLAVFVTGLLVGTLSPTRFSSSSRLRLVQAFNVLGWRGALFCWECDWIPGRKIRVLDSYGPPLLRPPLGEGFILRLGG